MENRAAILAARIGQNQEVAERLEDMLQHQEDRAYVFCRHASDTSRCTIFTVKARRSAAMAESDESFKQRQ